MAFAWKPNLSVGFDDIDRQHIELFERVNKLLHAAIVGKGRDEMGKTLDFLGDYVVRHFGAEERYMAQHRYPGLAVHKAEHSAFTDEFKSLKKRFDDGGATTQLVVTIQQQVCGWLLNHIGKSDKALGSFLTAKAL